MITPQEALEYRKLKAVEEYIDNELRKSNFEICLNQFKENLNTNDVDLLIEKYRDIGWEVDDFSCFSKDSFSGFFFGWIDIRLFFQIPEEVKNNGK